MKDQLASLLRHAFTGLAGLGGFLFSKGLIDQADVSSVDGAGASLGSALAVIIAAVLGRVLITLTAKIFRSGSGENDGSGSSSGGTALLFCLVCTAAAMGGLPSCSSTPWGPVKATLLLPEGNLSYSAKGGLEMEYRPGYGRMPKVYDSAK